MFNTLLFILPGCATTSYMLFQVDVDRESSEQQIKQFQEKAVRNRPPTKDCPFSTPRFTNQAGSMAYFTTFEKKVDSDKDIYWTTYGKRQIKHLIYGREDLTEPLPAEGVRPKYICVSTNNRMIKKAEGRYGCLMRSEEPFYVWPPKNTLNEILLVTFEYVVGVDWFSKISQESEELIKVPRFSRTKVLKLKCLMREFKHLKSVSLLKDEMEAVAKNEFIQKVDLEQETLGLQHSDPLSPEVNSFLIDAPEHMKAIDIKTNNENVIRQEDEAELIDREWGLASATEQNPFVIVTHERMKAREEAEGVVHCTSNMSLADSLDTAKVRKAHAIFLMAHQTSSIFIGSAIVFAMILICVGCYLRRRAQRLTEESATISSLPSQNVFITLHPAFRKRSNV